MTFPRKPCFLRNTTALNVWPCICQEPLNIIRQSDNARDKAARAPDRRGSPPEKMWPARPWTVSITCHFSCSDANWDLVIRLAGPWQTAHPGWAEATHCITSSLCPHRHGYAMPTNHICRESGKTWAVLFLQRDKREQLGRG